MICDVVVFLFPFLAVVELLSTIRWNLLAKIFFQVSMMGMRLSYRCCHLLSCVYDMMILNSEEAAGYRIFLSPEFFVRNLMHLG